MVALATALAGCGRLPECRSVLADALELLPQGDPVRPGIVAACASAENLLGRHRDAYARLQAAHRAAGLEHAVALALELAATAGFENRAKEMAERAERALSGAAGGGLEPARVAAVGQLALARYFLGLPAGDVADRAADGLDRLSDSELAMRLDLGLWVGWTEAVLERAEPAIAHCQRVIDISRHSGQGATLLVTMTAQAWAQLHAGHLTDAEATLAAATEVGRLAPHLFFATALGLRAQLATARGDYEGALRAGEECVEVARSADPGLIPGMSGLYMAVPLIELGEARAARDVILEMSGGDRELRTSRSGHAAAFEILTRAEITLGHLDIAEFWARRAEAATHAGKLGAEAALAHRATARVALARGDSDRCAHTALAAAKAASHAPVEAARCRLLAGQALAHAGEREHAIRTLQHATDELARIGADGYHAEAERALRTLGRRGTRHRLSPPPGAPKPSALTDREREIANLVGHGLTNRQIAATVFLSEKTVESHLTRVFEKLQVPNRTALARMIETAPYPPNQTRTTT